MKSLGQQYRKAVVLGAAGFVGINLVQELCNQGYEVVCFDRHASPHWPSIVRSIVGDFSAHPAELIEELDHALIFHLVSSCCPSNQTAHATEELNRDLLATIGYLEATKNRNTRWVFLSSGGTVYGQSDAEILTEASPTNPICTYGAVKLAIEKYFSIYNTLHKLDCVIVRLSNPYGPWQLPGRGQGLIAVLLHKALKREKIEIWGDGEQVRDYIYIADAISGMCSAAVLGRSGEIYNVGTGHGYSIKQLVAHIERSKSWILDLGYAPARAVDVKSNVLSNKKIYSHVGWRPVVNIESGIFLASNWMEQNPCD